MTLETMQMSDPGVQEMAQTLQAHEEQMTDDVPADRDGVRQRQLRTTEVWHVPTGQKREILIDLLTDALQQIDENGNPIFSQTPVDTKVVRGEVKCRLHADDPDRQLWSSMGLPYCTKDDLLNRYQASIHLSRRHKAAAVTIREHETEIREEEWKKEQRTRDDLLVDLVGRLVDQQTGIMPEGHMHRYEGKEPGSPCKMEGCRATRPE